MLDARTAPRMRAGGAGGGRAVRGVAGVPSYLPIGPQPAARARARLVPQTAPPAAAACACAYPPSSFRSPPGRLLKQAAAAAAAAAARLAHCLSLRRSVLPALVFKSVVEAR